MLACAPDRVKGEDFEPRRGERGDKASHGSDDTGFQEAECVV